MSKIIKVEKALVQVGTDDGQLLEIARADFDFTPKVGDQVEIYRNKNKTQVVLSTNQNGSANPQQSGSGINVNIVNESRNQNQNLNSGLGHKRQVNKIAYVLTAIILGSFGVHKFVAGYVGAGIVYLIFAWTFIPGFIGLIEGLVALASPADADGNIWV